MTKMHSAVKRLTVVWLWLIAVWSVHTSAACECSFTAALSGGFMLAVLVNMGGVVVDTLVSVVTAIAVSIGTSCQLFVVSMHSSWARL
jgi:hypothetical protein